MMRLPPRPAPLDAPPTSVATPKLTPLQTFLRGFRALRIRNYRLFWIGQLISLTGTWMQTTAQGWLVLQLTNSPLALGLVTTFQFLPSMLLSLFGGVIADRVPKYRLIVVTQSAALIQAALFGLLVWGGSIQLWQVYTLALLLGIINAIDTPTRQAFIIDLVGRDDVPNAIALNSLLFNSARIVGPALAGLLIAHIGLAPAFIGNALSFVAVLAGLLLMDRKTFRPTPPHTQSTIMQGIVEGLTYIWRTPSVLLIMIVIAFIGTFGYNFSVVLPLLSGFVLHTDAVGFGMLSSAFGMGSLVGGLVVAYSKQVTVKRLLIGATAFSLVLGTVALTPIFTVSLLLLAALGAAGIVFTTSANTLIQLTVPDALRGRVVSVYWLLFAGSTPIGALFIGSLANLIGVPETLLLCAVLCLIGVGGAWVYWQRSGMGAR